VNRMPAEGPRGTAASVGRAVPGARYSLDVLIHTPGDAVWFVY
jgi:hypothetical protein